MMISAMTLDPDLLWIPGHPSSSQATAFRTRINSRYSINLATYADLWKWSCNHRGAFWGEVWDYEEVIGSKGSGEVVIETVSPSANPPWFPDASLNWAENQLRHHSTYPDNIAIIQTSETCPGHIPSTRRIAQRELYQSVGRTQRAMRDAGVCKGDRVAFWGGNCAGAVIVLLATSALGGIFSSAAADFGVDGVVERLEQIRPKLLFVTNGVVYAETPRPLLPLLPALLGRLTVPPERTVVIEHLPASLVPMSPGLQGKKVENWDDFLDKGDGEVEFTRMGFNEPIWILFSSGTTGEGSSSWVEFELMMRLGKPKAIVHRQGGMLLDSLREHHLAGDVTRGDVYLYYTTPYVSLKPRSLMLLC